MSNILAFPSYSELFCIYTVEPRLTATSVIRSPRYHGHFFWPPGWTTIHFLWKRKKKFSLIWSPVNTAKFFWPIGDRINASSETQGQLVGSIKCSWWKFSVRSRRARLDLTENFHHEHFIDPTNCPWVSEDGINGVLLYKEYFREKRPFRICARYARVVGMSEIEGVSSGGYLSVSTEPKVNNR